jgi:hypothetical protein
VDVLIFLFVTGAVLCAFGLAANYVGADSRPRIGDDHRRPLSGGGR